MARFNVPCADITIANGTAASAWVKARETYDDADFIALFGPSALDAHTFVIELTDDPDAAAPNTYVWNNSSSDIGPPAAGKATQFPTPVARGFRIKDQTGNVVADRTWKMQKSYSAY